MRQSSCSCYCITYYFRQNLVSQINALVPWAKQCTKGHHTNELVKLQSCSWGKCTKACTQHPRLYWLEMDPYTGNPPFLSFIFLELRLHAWHKVEPTFCWFCSPSSHCRARVCYSVRSSHSHAHQPHKTITPNSCTLYQEEVSTTLTIAHTMLLITTLIILALTTLMDITATTLYTSMTPTTTFILLPQQARLLPATVATATIITILTTLEPMSTQMAMILLTISTITPTITALQLATSTTTPHSATRTVVLQRCRT